MAHRLRRRPRRLALWPRNLLAVLVGNTRFRRISETTRDELQTVVDRMVIWNTTSRRYETFDATRGLWVDWDDFYGRSNTQEIQPARLVPEPSFPAAVITTGVVDLAPSILVPEPSFPVHSVVSAVLTPALLVPQASSPAAVVTTTVDLAPALLVPRAFFPAAVVTTGVVDLTPTLLVPRASFPIAVVTTTVDTMPAILVPETSFPAPTVAIV